MERLTTIGFEVNDPFENIEEVKLLKKYCKFQSYRPTSDEIVTFLLPYSIPSFDFVTENWQKITQMGNVRKVFSIDSLLDGSDPKLVVKSPERVFTKEEFYLQKDLPWWGGARTLERKVLFHQNPLIERQILWETIFLLELNQKGIRAEQPLAIRQSSSGGYSLIVNKINVPSNYAAVKNVEGYPTFDEIYKKTGLKPYPDWQGHNILKDINGYQWIIDVNRWSWPGCTDNFHRELIQLIRQTN